MEKLSQYLTKNELSARAFAKLAGISAAYCNKLLKNECNPTVQKAALIQNATNGEVPISSWLSPSSLPEGESLPTQKRKNTRCSVQDPAKGAA